MNWDNTLPQEQKINLKRVACAVSSFALTCSSTQLGAVSVSRLVETFD